MIGYLNALVTFSSNGERNRAANAVQAWVSNYNSTHPSEVFVGQTVDTTYTYPADDEVNPGKTLRAFQAAYMCTSYAGIEAAQLAIQTDVNANAYVDIINLSTWQTP